MPSQFYRKSHVRRYTEEIDKRIVRRRAAQGESAASLARMLGRKISTIQGWLAKANPIPLRWTSARVRRLKGGKVQVALPVRRRK